MNLDRKTCEALIERLADKNLSFGCYFTIRDELVKHDDLKGKLCRVTGGNHDWEATMFEYEEYFYTQHWAYGNRIPTKNLLLEDLLHQSGYDQYESEAEDYINILGHPIMLTDVLEKAYGQIFMQGEAHFLQLWNECGFTSSLQQILEEAKWETVVLGCDTHIENDIYHPEGHHTEFMKGPAAELFSYLSSLFPET